MKTNKKYSWDRFSTNQYADAMRAEALSSCYDLRSLLFTYLLLSIRYEGFVRTAGGGPIPFFVHRPCGSPRVNGLLINIIPRYPPIRSISRTKRTRKCTFLDICHFRNLLSRKHANSSNGSAKDRRCSFPLLSFFFLKTCHFHSFVFLSKLFSISRALVRTFVHSSGGFSYFQQIGKSSN